MLLLVPIVYYVFTLSKDVLVALTSPRSEIKQLLLIIIENHTLGIRQAIYYIIRQASELERDILSDKASSYHTILYLEISVLYCLVAK